MQGVRERMKIVGGCPICNVREHVIEGTTSSMFSLFTRACARMLSVCQVQAACHRGLDVMWLDFDIFLVAWPAFRARSLHREARRSPSLIP